MDPAIVASQTAWSEARGEGQDGMHAVLSVIGNRAANPRWWGHDIITVCLSQSRGIHQFSCWNTWDPNSAEVQQVNMNDPQMVQALELAQQLVAGTLPDITGGADSYYRAGTRAPSWATAVRFIKQIGHHRFYRVEIPMPAMSPADELNEQQLVQSATNKISEG